MKQRIIIIGGMGPQASLELHRRMIQQALANGGLTDKEYRIAEAKLQRALVRLSVKE